MLAANVNAGGNYSQGKFFKLTADIVLNNALTGSPKAWTPIGVYALNDSSRAFKGSFNGGGHTIKGVYISNSLDNQGLFGYISGATVKNVGVIDGSISGKIYVGGIVGCSTGSSVENCYNTSPVAGIGYVGGVVGGGNTGNLVKNCYNTGAVTGTITDQPNAGTGIGGVAGIYTGGSVENCYNTGKVSGASPVGGVVGILQGGGAVKNGVSLGETVNGTSPVGRVISGLGNGGTVSASYARKDMKIGASGSEAIVTGGAADNQNGADLTVSAATPQAWGTWFSDTAAWDITGVGNLVGGANLPILKNFSAGQNPTLPGSIQAGTYTLTVNLNGGNSGITGGNYAAGSVVAINAGTKASYTFSGWTTSNGGTFENATLTNTNFTMPSEPTTITATWTSDSPVRTFNISDGAIKVENGSTVGKLKVTYETGQIEDNIDSGDMLKIIQTTASTATTNTIVVNTSGDKTVNITLSDVNIDVSATSNSCAFEIQDNSVVNLTLTGSNTLKSGVDKNVTGKNKAGLQVQTKGGKTATLTIDGTGTLDVTGGGLGAGIGGGEGGSAGVITINGGTITARSVDGAGIGSGYGNNDPGGVITITGGTVTATATGCGAGIGGGDCNVNGCTINITGGVITATGGDNGGAGIGSGRESGTGKDKPGTITISGTAKVTATGGQDAAGIGGGVGTYDFNLNKLVGLGAGPINISGGTVIAKGGIFGAGIGGGNAGAGGEITISGGNVTATGGPIGGAGIGGGKDGKGGTIKIDQGAMVIASAYMSMDTKNAIDDTDGLIEASAGGKTVANILMANYTAPVASKTTTTVKNGATKVAAFAPTSPYQSIAFTVPAGSYTLYKGAIPQTHSDPEKQIFEVSALGLNIFSNVKDDSSLPPEPQTYTVSGTIKDTNNNPVSGATVTLTDSKDSSKTYTGTTDADGNYSIPSVPDASYTVTVSKGSETLGSGSVTVKGSDVSGDSGNITVTPPTPQTTPTHTVSGTIKDTNSNPVSGATVTLTDPKDSSKTYTGITDADGNYSIPSVPDASYTVSITKGSETLGSSSVTVNGSNVSGDSGNITVTPPTPTPPTTPTYTVSGTIKDTNSNPVSGATVTLTDPKDSSKTYTGTTDADGNYSIPSVPDESYTVSVTKGSETLGSGSVTVNGSNVSGDSGNITVTPPTPQTTPTYTITFNSNGGSNVRAMIETYGTAIILPTPTKAGYNFVGWYRDSSFATSYLATTMGAENITLHAKWEQLTYEVSGNIKDEDNANVDSATVKLMAGSRQVAQTTTDANGVFSISGIPSGIYNLVISKGTDQIITLTITVSGNTTTGSVTLPKGNKNSVVEVKSGTPDIIVDKLNDFFASNQFTQDDSNVIDAGGTVEIRLIVEQRIESGDNAAENAQSIIAAAGSGKEIGIFLNLSLSKIITPTPGGTAEQPIPITELDHPLIIDIPLPTELQGKNNYVVYRYHGTEVQTITQTNSDAEYIELSADGKSITLHAKKFSTYAIGYTAASTPSRGGGSGGGTAAALSITTDSNTGGKVTISSDQKTATITPEEGYIIFDVLVDGKSVGAIAAYTFTDSENHKIRALFAEKTGVKRLAGVNRVDTALEIAKAANAGKVSNVILATAENYPDSLAGSVLAGKYNAPILLVGTEADDQQKVLDYVQSNLETTGTIYILGGYAAVSQDIESRIKALGFGNIIRLGGKDRYETSAIIAAHMVKDNDGTPIVITTGEDYPDALSISSIASRYQYPILLTAKNELSSAVKQKIQDIKPSKIYLIGLEGSINQSVEEEILQTTALAKDSIIRIGGADRFETSLAIARHFKPTGNYVCIATGNNFPDALSGSLYAARMNAPILLVDETISDQMTSYFKEEGIKGATIFGGEAVVGKKIFEELTNLVKP
ncbi:cell wall-binding repeat-containing protein [Desulfosporosinus sp. Sb-LF]|uniref:cell wall-binding repeat-containing protein n=1 Tax=Desulfosporosinus sp. Sb-LF TaxID=2560027 RepID=UPI0032B74AC4